MNERGSNGHTHNGVGTPGWRKTEDNDQTRTAIGKGLDVGRTHDLRFCRSRRQHLSASQRAGEPLPMIVHFTHVLILCTPNAAGFNPVYDTGRGIVPSSP